MTILAQNLKTIRKSLKCTQMALSEVLEIGFRTYVRYEAGERDAPVSVLIKIARLGNLSLDRLLTTEVTAEDLDIPDTEKLPAGMKSPEVIGGSLEEGRLNFKGIKTDFLVTSTAPEKKLLTRFRKLDRAGRESYLLDLEWMLSNPSTPQKPRRGKKVSRKTQKAKNAANLKRMVKGISKITVRG